MYGNKLSNIGMKSVPEFHIGITNCLYMQHKNTILSKVFKYLLIAFVLHRPTTTTTYKIFEFDYNVHLVSCIVLYFTLSIVIN